VINWYSLAQIVDKKFLPLFTVLKSSTEEQYPQYAKISLLVFLAQMTWRHKCVKRPKNNNKR